MELYAAPEIFLAQCIMRWDAGVEHGMRVSGVDAAPTYIPLCFEVRYP
jgi:hypothetical protein